MAICTTWRACTYARAERCLQSLAISLGGTGPSGQVAPFSPSLKQAPVLASAAFVGSQRRLASATIRADSVAKLPTIRRCDAIGCSPVVVRALLSGAFTNVTAESGGYFLKFAAVDLGDLGAPVGDFVEVASQCLGTITYFGSCPAVGK